MVLWEHSQKVVTGWRASYNKDWVLTWTVLGKQPFGRLNQRERIFDIQHMAILNTERRLFQKITNTMTLVDYPLFSGVVVIHSLHVSSFQEAHHQEFIFPCTVSLWYSV